ncbi:MAG: hypothetical protein HP490_08365 [Nitrospira sp.]|nr:hypothetical protein [Nitrospira sp.]
MRGQVSGVVACTLWAVFCMAESGQAGLWKCAQPDGTVLFQDGGGPGCREIETPPELQSTRFPAQRGVAELQSSAEPTARTPFLGMTTGQALSSRPFASASRSIPALSYRDLSPGMRAKGWNIPNKGDIQILQVEVSYRPAGNGPSLSTDHHFMEEARQAFAVAVMAAAKATQYDPRFLTVQLTMPMSAASLYSGVRVDGPSAGAAWALAVTSALLGDPLRSDVCFSGTIDENLVIGPVGALEHKIEGCRLLPQFHELLVPAGQQTFAITDKGMARSIKVTEVSTLADAYEVATGQPLRPAP